jgi:hypothetical protein
MSDAIFMEREYQVDYSRSAKKDDQDVGDPISKGTARLYTEFHRGTINSFVNDALGGGFDFDTIYGTRTKAINALQFTIWWLEDEIEDEINTDENDFLAALKATGGVLTDWKADYDPGSDIPGVYVMNLSGFDENEQTVYYQDVLVAPVPEPATLSLWALGLAGCAGAGAYRRRRQKA